MNCAESLNELCEIESGQQLETARIKRINYEP